MRPDVGRPAPELIDAPPDLAGVAARQSGDDAAAVIGKLQDLSSPFGTAIALREAEGIGVIELT